jgi:hypothetical protein
MSIFKSLTNMEKRLGLSPPSEPLDIDGIEDRLARIREAGAAAMETAGDDEMADKIRSYSEDALIDFINGVCQHDDRKKN